ncbi:MAG: sugar phosphate isomerase/epimerase [Verrucomicrobia bacterium]|nr:sugar phosphate isomerase/epimerase [Verrucomicrobiota bacterium]
MLRRMSTSTTPLVERLGICSWSLQPDSADDLFQKLAETGIPRIQIALDPIRENAGGAWSNFAARCAQQGVRCVSGMFGTVGEDYSTLDSIRRTGGVVPDATWDQNWRQIQANANVARDLGVEYIAFHAGFLPHESTDPAFAKLVGRLKAIAEFYGARGMSLGLETGQEQAETLRTFLEQLGCPNVGVNFDPANMILYDQGDPILALRTLGPWLRSCHLKDAVRTKVPGTWGEEVVLGTGQVDWPRFFQTLTELGFSGQACIEREAGTQRVADIRTAQQFVRDLLAQA